MDMDKCSNVSRRDKERMLEFEFKGMNCSFTAIGFNTVYGMVDSIGIETERGQDTVIIQMNNKRYFVDYEYLWEQLKLL
jgi:formylmethanofuran dehydrogenase subunit E